MRKPIPGDPLTGSLPVTHLVIPQSVMGPTRQRQPRPDAWPVVADPQAVTLDQLRPGRIAYIRTRFGIRRLQVRTIARSREPGSHRGCPYIVGMYRNGLCRAVWVEQIVSVQSAQQALNAAKALKAIGAG